MKDSISSAIIISVVFLSGTLGHYIHEKAEVNLEEKLDTVAADDKYHKVPKFTKKWERQGEVEGNEINSKMNPRMTRHER